MIYHKCLQLTILLLVFLSHNSNAQPQNIKTYLEANVSSISDSDHDSRFKHIKESIGDARVVLLGEQNHGDGTTMQFKTDLVKYLHEECDFDLLIFESNFYPIQKLREDDNPDFNEVKKYIFPIWTNCTQCSDLFTYLESSYQSNKPLIVSAIDNQKYFYKFDYVAELKELCIENNVLIPDTAWFYSAIRKSLKFGNSNSKEEISKLIKCVKAWHIEDNDFFHQEVKCLLAYFELKQTEYRKGVKKYEYHNVRDSAMTNNLLWLLQERYPNKKAIVWAHNVHISKDVETSFYYFGTGLHDVLGEDMYNIGFTSYDGFSRFSSGNVATKKNKPNSKSLEAWMKNNNHQTSFINLRGLPEKNTKFSANIIYEVSMKKEWANIFDGIIYIPTMEPCIKLDEGI
ncbi:erythromycin esterase family protein [Saccharicrinis aurantiacus]|uniref:erythromycin esterase family protein n=1 Tax=Saccharicrinis aurantiacus TaxID=1849719 RepID=UPI00094FB280|nr:erythromycin esterase family protein [Saccharicrinis aurantiacus]